MPRNRREFNRCWRRTSVKDFLSRTRAGWFVGAIAASLGLWAVPALESYRPLLPFVGPTLYGLGYLGVRLSRAPYEMAIEDEAMHAVAVEDKEREINRLEKRLAEAKGEVARLTYQITDHQRHQSLADELTERVEWATHELLNKAPMDRRMPDDLWFMSAREWEDSVRTVLAKYECDKQETTSFEVLNAFDIGMFGVPYHSDAAMIFARVHRLNQILAAHKQMADSLKVRPVGLTIGLVDVSHETQRL